jgi:hypothetical protein
MSDEPRVTITWTRAKRDNLARAYYAAHDAGEPSFTFEGHTLVTMYAWYLLKYLEQHFGAVPVQIALKRS